MCLTVSIPVSARCQVQRSQREATFACCSALRAEEATSENARRFKFQVLTSVSSLNDALVLSFSPTMITCVTRLSTWLAQHESTRSPRSARQKGPAGESLEQPKKLTTNAPTVMNPSPLLPSLLLLGVLPAVSLPRIPTRGQFGSWGRMLYADGRAECALLHASVRRNATAHPVLKHSFRRIVDLAVAHLTVLLRLTSLAHPLVCSHREARRNTPCLSNASPPSSLSSPFVLVLRLTLQYARRRPSPGRDCCR